MAPQDAARLGSSGPPDDAERTAVPPGDTVPQADFDALWAQASGVPGWCSREQARDLWDAAMAMPAGGRALEIGSHQGRSTLVLAAAARHVGARVTAVDPFVQGRLFGGPATRRLFEGHLADAGLDGTVDLVQEYSGRLLPTWQDPLDLVYVDGKHDYWTVVGDLRWGRHLPPDGLLLVHDAFSSIGVTSGMVVAVLLGREWSYVGRTGSLARLRRRPPTGRDQLRFVAQLPWFLRNVVVKLLLRLRLRPLTRALGHTERHDPY